MRFQSSIRTLIATCALGFALAAPLTAHAQGGGADFTKVVSSTIVNNRWLVRFQTPSGQFTGDLTHAKMGKIVNGKAVLMSRQEAFAAMVPGETLWVRYGSANGQGIIAILIGLFVGR